MNADDRKEILKDLESDPQVQKQLQRFVMTWKEFSRLFSYDYPDYFPPINTMDIEDNKIYITTFRKKEGKTETLILNLKGHPLKETFISPTEKKWIMAVLMGVRLETIHNGKFYYIQENEDEEWELKSRDIN